jgi:plastocyanin
MRSANRAAFTVLLLASGLVSGVQRVSAYTATIVTDGGSISGVVRFQGRAPAPKPLVISKDRDVCGVHPAYDQSLIVGRHGGIANAVITVVDIASGRAADTRPVNFDQRGCEYVPHVLAFVAGTTVNIINSDNILHNVHTESSVNPVIDFAQPGFKKMISVTVAKPEVIKVGCDAHNWMSGWWYVAANPYYAVTGADGRYTLKDVPPGTYALRVWQEKLGTQTTKVTVKPGQQATADFAMKPGRG